MLIQSKVSVIIPVYNGEKFLKQCLNSVLKQTYSNLEIIAVDDGSTDNSASILNEYALKDSRIKIIKHEKNKGLYIGRITGVKNATGDYLCFVDADDEIAVDWIRFIGESNPGRGVRYSRREYGKCKKRQKVLL